jgi:hypothetical protein
MSYTLWVTRSARNVYAFRYSWDIKVSWDSKTEVHQKLSEMITAHEVLISSALPLWRGCVLCHTLYEWPDMSHIFYSTSLWTCQIHLCYSTNLFIFYIRGLQNWSASKAKWNDHSSRGSNLIYIASLEGVCFMSCYTLWVSIYVPCFSLSISVCYTSYIPHVPDFD